MGNDHTPEARAKRAPHPQRAELPDGAEGAKAIGNDSHISIPAPPPPPIKPAPVGLPPPPPPARMRSGPRPSTSSPPPTLHAPVSASSPPSLPCPPSPPPPATLGTAPRPGAQPSSHPPHGASTQAVAVTADAPPELFPEVPDGQAATGTDSSPSEPLHGRRRRSALASTNPATPVSMAARHPGGSVVGPSAAASAPQCHDSDGPSSGRKADRFPSRRAAPPSEQAVYVPPTPIHGGPERGPDQGTHASEPRPEERALVVLKPDLRQELSAPHPARVHTDSTWEATPIPQQDHDLDDFDASGKPAGRRLLEFGIPITMIVCAALGSWLYLWPRPPQRNAAAPLPARSAVPVPTVARPSAEPHSEEHHAAEHHHPGNHRPAMTLGSSEEPGARRAPSSSSAGAPPAQGAVPETASAGSPSILPSDLPLAGETTKEPRTRSRPGGGKLKPIRRSESGQAPSGLNAPAVATD